GLFFAGFFDRSLFGGRRFLGSRGFLGHRAAFGDFLGDRGRVLGRGFGGNLFGHRVGDGFGGRFALHRTGRIGLGGFGSGGFLGGRLFSRSGSGFLRSLFGLGQLRGLFLGALLRLLAR